MDARADSPADSTVETKVEPLSGRERGAAEREPGGEILSEAAQQPSRRTPPKRLPDVYVGGVRIPHSYAYRDPDAIPETEEFDAEEVTEYDCPDPHTVDGLDGYPSVSPLDHRFPRFHTLRETVEESPEERAARVVAANRAPRCLHIKPSGMRCKAPAMRGMDFCYYHKRTHLGPRLLYPTLMMLEDAHGIQAALMEVLCAILEGTLDRKTAAMLLYGLQTAASNLKRVTDIDPAECAVEEPHHDRMPDGIFKPEPASGYALEHPEFETVAGVSEAGARRRDPERAERVEGPLSQNRQPKPDDPPDPAIPSDDEIRALLAAAGKRPPGNQPATDNRSSGNWQPATGNSPQNETPPEAERRCG